MAILLSTLGGLIGGSLLNVVAYRLPRGESLLAPGPRHTSVSSRYPIVEALTAVLAVAVVLVKHSPRDVVLGLVLVAVLVAVSLIDFDHRIIPNKIMWPAAVAALAIGLAFAPSKVPEQLIAGAAAGGFLLVFALAYPRGMGMGDVKLAAVLGLFLGRAAAPALLVGVLAAAVVGAAVMARVGVEKGRKTGVPLGPFLALGGVVGLLAGTPIVHWYLSSLG